jgi:opacity protein-like surface antigen
MNLMTVKTLAAAAACSLTAIGAASAQTVLTTDTAYIESAPVYVAPTARYGYFPGDYVAVQPQVTVVAPQVVAPQVVAPQVVAPPAYTVQSGPRYGYNSGYYGINYAAPLTCTIDMFGNRTCD